MGLRLSRGSRSSTIYSLRLGSGRASRDQRNLLAALAGSSCAAGACPSFGCHWALVLLICSKGSSIDGLEKEGGLKNSPAWSVSCPLPPAEERRRGSNWSNHD